MKRLTLFILTITLTLLLIEATFAVTVKISPASQQIPIPGTGTVNVSIEGVTNLGAFEFKIKYDSSIVKILQSTDVQLGTFISSTGRTVVPTGPTIDNDAGELTFGAFTFGANPGPDGDGVLATIVFTAQSEGTSTLDLTNVQVTDINGDVISIDVFDGQIQVGAPPTTIVKIDPESQQISLSGTAEINVKIEDVTNLGAFEFKLKYDGSIVKVLQADDVQVGDFLGGTGRTVVPTGPTIDNDAGELTFGAFTFGANPGPDGDGVLATIVFTAQNEGTSVLDLTNVQVTDIDGDVMPINVIDGEVQVGVPPPMAIVKIDPESQQIPLSGTAEVNVKVEDVTNLGAFEFTLKYDGSIVKVLQATDVQLGDFLGSTGRTVVPTGPTIDNDAGEVTFGAFTFGANPGPDGDGVLATIIFTAQSEGASALDLTNVQVTDIDGNVISINVIDGELVPVDGCNPGDVSGDGTISAYDASLILQYVVGLITEFPVNKVGAPNHNSSPRNYTVMIPEQSAKSGDRIDVPIFTSDATGLMAGGITLKYNPAILKAVNVTSQTLFLNGAYNKANVNRQGEVRFAFATTQPMKGHGNLFTVEFEILPNTTGETSPLILDNVELSNSLSITKMDGSVTVLPSSSALLQNFPNPFNPETWIPFELAKEAEVVIRIYNIKGELVRTLSIGYKPAGSYLSKEKAVFWNGKNQNGEAVANGLYFYTLKAGKFQATRNMILVK